MKGGEPIKYFYTSAGVKTAGTGSGGGNSSEDDVFEPEEIEHGWAEMLTE